MELYYNRLDGTDANLAHHVKNIHWSAHTTLEEIYGDLLHVSQKAKQTRVYLVGALLLCQIETISCLLIVKT